MMIFEKFSFDDLIAEFHQIKKVIENFDKETKMWRNKYINSKDFPSKEEKDLFTAYLMFTPAGIENISEWEKELKCYRDTQEKIK